MPFGAAVALVLPEPFEEALEEAAVQLFRIGYDRIVGGLDGGVAAWAACRRAGRAYPTIAHRGDRTTSIARPRRLALDVRDPHEWRDDGHRARARSRSRSATCGPARHRCRATRPITVMCKSGAAGVDRREHARRGRVRRTARRARAALPTGRRGQPRRSRTIRLGDDARRRASARTSARRLDAADPLAGWRERFLLPHGRDGRPKAYLAGHVARRPAGRRPATRWSRARPWARLGVEGWFDAERGWLEADGARPRNDGGLVGARPGEVATLNTLTVEPAPAAGGVLPARRARGRRSSSTPRRSLPTGTRWCRSSGFTAWIPRAISVVVRPRDGEATLRDRGSRGGDPRAPRPAGGRAAGGRQLRHRAGCTTSSGSRRPIHDAGCASRCGTWPMPRATCPLALHDAGRRRARHGARTSTSTAGPGSIGQLFVHERHATDAADLRLTGWWGNDRGDAVSRWPRRSTPAAGADGWRISTPPILSLAPIARHRSRCSTRSACAALREKSVALTAYLETR